MVLKDYAISKSCYSAFLGGKKPISGICTHSYVFHWSFKRRLTFWDASRESYLSCMMSSRRTRHLCVWTVSVSAQVLSDDSTIQSPELRPCPLEPPRRSASLMKSHYSSNCVLFLHVYCVWQQITYFCRSQYESAGEWILSKSQC